MIISISAIFSMDQLSLENIVMRVSHFVLWVFQAVFFIKDSFFYADLTLRLLMKNIAVWLVHKPQD